MDYTKNYHLPQWVKSDRIMMEDFNQMCQDIEQGITSTAHALEVKIGTAQATADTAKNKAEEAAKLPYAIGSYIGDGTIDRHISVGFRPRFVIVSGQFEAHSPSSGADLYLIASSGTGFELMFGITEDGFRVRHSPNDFPDLNSLDRTYDYIAFR